MEGFTECLVQRSPTTQDRLKRYLLMAASAVVVVILAMATFYFPFFAAFSVVILAGVIYACYLLLSRLYVEYEYIITGGEIDVDKITGRSKRKRLLTADIRTFESFQPYADSDKSAGGATVVEVCTSLDDPDNYCATFRHERLGDVYLIFTPNQACLELIAASLPAQLRAKAAVQNG